MIRQRSKRQIAEMENFFPLPPFTTWKMRDTPQVLFSKQSEITNDKLGPGPLVIGNFSFVIGVGAGRGLGNSGNFPCSTEAPGSRRFA